MLLAAELRGELGELERQTTTGAGLPATAGEPSPTPCRPRPSARPATVFRYEHNLLAAEELEAWLAARGLSAADWNGYLRRSIFVSAWVDELEQIASEFAVGDDEIEAALPAEAICSGFLRRAAEQLAEDAALAATDEGPSGRAATSPPPRARGGCGARTHSERSGGRARDRAGAHGLDWIRVEAETLELADAEAAREAALCVRVDGRTLADVADECGLSADVLVLYLADAEPELRTALVRREPG